MTTTLYPLLSTIHEPADLRGLKVAELEQLAQELRSKTIATVAKTGGHLGAGLGVVELTVALHYVLNTPHDLLIWDIGHQAYPHKILTGRSEKIETIRQPGGLSGFTKRSESIYDPFGAGHSSTSISAALGMAVASSLTGDYRKVVAVIGDGGISAGMAYEAMNNAGITDNRLIVVLNDNDMSIAPPVGSMSRYLSRLISSKPYLTLRNMAKNLVSLLPSGLEHFARKTEQYAKEIAAGGNFFEEMGFYYVGPVNGHHIDDLVTVLTNVLHDRTIDRPILLHVVTEKGRGFTSPEGSSEKFHAVSCFDITTGVQQKSTPKAPSFTKVFAEALIAEAERDESIVAITAAMPSGTGLDKFAARFPSRTFDVGIAEQHAVTFAAGLACSGLKPFVALYSTFLQRAYDQVVHDVAIQKLPVRFALDRAGYVGADGATHAGSFDITTLAALPHFIIMAPADEAELCHMIATAAAIDDAPSAVRYPRGEGYGVPYTAKGEVLPIGKGRIVHQPADATVAILSLGTRLQASLQAAERLAAEGIAVTVADARFAKPLDVTLIADLATTHTLLITVEEGSIGGFGAHVLDYLTTQGLLDQGTLKVRTLHFPDEFLDHDSQSSLNARSGLEADQIISLIRLLAPARSPYETAE